MKKFIIFFAALAAVLSCSKENPSNYNPVDGTYSVTLTASAPGADTKTTLVDGEGTKFVHWSKGDAIKVLFFPNTTSLNASYSGSNGVFSSHFDEEISSTAFFRCDSWSWGSKVEELGISKSLTEKGVAVYPATATAKSTKPDGMYTYNDTEISFVLPSTQTAVKNNIESNLNFSYAEVKLPEFQNTISNGSKTDLSFMNACAMIELTLPSTLDKKVMSISLKSNSDISLTGKGTVKLSGYNNAVSSPFGVDVTDGAGVTLNNPDGFEAGAKYYVVVWPGVHGSGLTIDFIAEDATVATKTTGAVTLEASHVKPYTFNKGLVFESAAPKEYSYVYADGSQGDEVRNDIVGVIIFHGNPKTEFNDSQLPDQYCNGLAISVSSRKCAWNSTQLSSIPASVKLSGSTSVIADFSMGGYTATQAFGSNNYTVFANGTAPSGTSGWYLGAAKEWKYILANKDKINKLLEGVGDAINPSQKSEAFWLPYFYSTKAAIVYISGGTPYFNYEQYYYRPDLLSYCYNARPIFAF